uniref:Uncharacterized protein n=1 Tax=Rhizophora mucronata TaxID=61149 RepID=A0A2P2N1N6_RHIMU
MHNMLVTKITYQLNSSNVRKENGLNFFKNRIQQTLQIKATKQDRRVVCIIVQS